MFDVDNLWDLGLWQCGGAGLLEQNINREVQYGFQIFFIIGVTLSH
jgi:hypothetical protein